MVESRARRLFGNPGEHACFSRVSAGSSTVSDYEVLRLATVVFCHMLVNVTGFCWGHSLFRPRRAVSKARNSCKSRPGVSRAERTSTKVVQSLLAALALLMVAPSALGAQLRIGGGLIEIEFVKSA